MEIIAVYEKRKEREGIYEWNKIKQKNMKGDEKVD